MEISRELFEQRCRNNRLFMLETVLEVGARTSRWDAARLVEEFGYLFDYDVGEYDQGHGYGNPIERFPEPLYTEGEREELVRVQEAWPAVEDRYDRLRDDAALLGSADWSRFEAACRGAAAELGRRGYLSDESEDPCWEAGAG